ASASVVAGESIAAAASPASALAASAWRPPLPGATSPSTRPPAPLAPPSELWPLPPPQPRGESTASAASNQPQPKALIAPNQPALSEVTHGVTPPQNQSGP